MSDENIDKKLSGLIDYDSILDLSLSANEYQEKLEDLLEESHIGLIERRKIVRQKIQEFKDLQRHAKRSKS